MTLARRRGPPGQREIRARSAESRAPSWRREIREPAGYEWSLVIKALLAVAMVALIVTLRALYLT
jgi:hypothetical protein